MRLTKEQSEALLQKLAHLNSVCPLCGCGRFFADGVVYQLVECTGKTIVMRVGTTFQPVISASCEQCGYTILFNALMSGVITMDYLENYVEPPPQA